MARGENIHDMGFFVFRFRPESPDPGSIDAEVYSRTSNQEELTYPVFQGSFEENPEKNLFVFGSISIIMIIKS